MAAALARKIAADYGLEDEFEFRSAGLAAFPDAPASPEAVAVLAEAGIDLPPHRAVRLTAEHVRWADLIFTMTLGQKIQLLESFPEAWGKVFVLRELLAPDAAELQEEFAAAWKRMQEKRERFFSRYGRLIKELEEERARLLRRLEEVEDALFGYRKLLEEELREERRQLEALEGKFSRYDIPDPIGGPREAYRACADSLSQVLGELLRSPWRLEGT